ADDTQLFAKTFGWPDQVRSYLQRSAEMQAGRREGFMGELARKRGEHDRELQGVMRALAGFRKQSSLNPKDVERAVEGTQALRASLRKLAEAAEEINREEELLRVPDGPTDFAAQRAALEEEAAERAAREAELTGKLEGVEQRLGATQRDLGRLQNKNMTEDERVRGGR
ncbi:MAG: hypothetical protein ACK4YT_14245, partial [Sphingomonas sp.]